MAPTTILPQTASRLLLNPRAWALSQPRVSSGANRLLFARAFSSTPAAGNSAGNQLRRRYQAQLDKQMRTRPSMSGGGSEVTDMAREQMTSNLSIGTYVTPPIGRYPFSFNFTWTLTKRRFLDAMSVFLFRWGSKPAFLKAPVWKVKRSAIITQAKALHRTMGEALAAGDKAALRQTCVPRLASKLSSAIDARRRGTRKSWELVRYNQSLRYPRLADHKLRVTVHPQHKNLPAVYQAVVTIASRQRLVEYDDSKTGAGKAVPGSEKEVDLVENVVLMSLVDPDTYEQGPWMIWGTMNETTKAGLEYEEATITQLQSMPQ